MSEAVMNKNASGVYQAIPAFDCDEQMVTVYGPHDNYLERTQVIYERAKSEFNSLKMGDPQILELAERWRVVAVQLMRTACGFFGKLNRTDETRARALQIMDMVTKDSASRSSSVSRYYDLLEGKFPEQKEMLRIVEKADLKHLEVVDRMIRTQISYIEKEDEENGGLTREQRMEREASKDVRKTYDRIPKGHVYRPAYPYPPERIPEDQLVPGWPGPIQRIENIPVEEKVYDTELDEFVLPKGYISEDGLIDDQSVVYYPEIREVEFGYRGGPRYRWKYWKARNDRDVPIAGEWAVEYYQRFYKQFVLEPEHKVLEPTVEELLPEYEYNKIPEKIEK